MEKKFLTTIGEDVPVTVVFELEPEQKQINYPTDKAQPGFPASINILAVEVDGKDISYVLKDSCIDALEDECWENLEE